MSVQAPEFKTQTFYTVSSQHPNLDGRVPYGPYSTNGKTASTEMSLDQARRWAFNNGNFRPHAARSTLVVLSRTVTTFTYPTAPGEVSPRVVTDMSGWRVEEDAAPSEFHAGEEWLVRERGSVREYPVVLEAVEGTLPEDRMIAWPQDMDFPVRKVGSNR